MKERISWILTGIAKLQKDAMGNCLSTSRKTNGAVAVFLPGVAERLAYLLDSDFYMVFTSIHEVMIHNDHCVDPDDLENVLEDTIKEQHRRRTILPPEFIRLSGKRNNSICVTPEKETDDITDPVI